MHITFVYGRDSELRAAEGTDRACGGMVAGLLSLSTSLAERGHEVDVFARCDQPGIHRGVRYHAREELAGFAEVVQPDVVVVIPDGLPLLFPIRTRARVLWTGNAFSSGDVALTASWPWATQLGEAGQRARLYPLSLFSSSIDLVVAKSNWQQRHLSEQMGLPEDRFRVISNGVDLDKFVSRDWPRDRHRIVYTSQARRGLDALIDLFPAIKSSVPQAELHVFSYDGDAPAWLSERAAALPGVHWRGRVSKSMLADELRSAAVMVYPSTTRETFCTSVAEAQAAGLPVVCSSQGALPERVRDGIDGFVIDDDPRSDEFGSRFVDAVVSLLTNDARRAGMGRAATAMAAQRYDWDGVAEQWEAELLDLTARRPLRMPDVSVPYLLDPAVLRVGDRGHTARVPADLAEQWLRSAWASYGYDGTIPGLWAAADVSA